jgi:hypothetical protein
MHKLSIENRFGLLRQSIFYRIVSQTFLQKVFFTRMTWVDKRNAFTFFKTRLKTVCKPNCWFTLRLLRMKLSWRNVGYFSLVNMPEKTQKVINESSDKYCTCCYRYFRFCYLWLWLFVFILETEVKLIFYEWKKVI